MPELARLAKQLKDAPHRCFVIQQLLTSSPGESPMQHSREDGFSGLLFDL
jgi:hypothetical protein